MNKLTNATSPSLVDPPTTCWRTPHTRLTGNKPIAMGPAVQDISRTSRFGSYVLPHPPSSSRPRATDLATRLFQGACHRFRTASLPRLGMKIDAQLPASSELQLLA